MKYRLLNVLACICASIFLQACGTPPPDARIDMLATPAAGDSFAPQIFKADGRISLSWLEATENGHRLRYATWEETGWSPARTVKTGERWFANWADLPGVRPLANGGWLAWWLQKTAPETYAYAIRLAFSDNGIDWHEAPSPHGDKTPTEHGFVTAFDLSGNGFALAWLDGRYTQAGAENAHHAAGGMTLRHALFDASGRQVGEAEVDGLVCDCCQTDSARAGDATVLVYRNRTEAEIRDIHLARFENGAWAEPVLVHADGWKIDGCPVNGPAVAAEADAVAVAWFTAAAGKGEVRLAFSADGGRSFSAPLRVDDGRPQGRVDVLMQADGNVLVSWVDQGESGAEVRVRPVSANGRAGKSFAVAGTSASRAAGFPRMVPLDDGSVLLAWTAVGNAARTLRSARIRLD